LRHKGGITNKYNQNQRKLGWMASFWQLQVNDEKLKGDISTLV